MTPSTHRPYVTWFEDVGRDDLAIAGGKGANLGELVRAGLPVPPGCIVTTAAYRSLVDDSDVAATIETLDAIDADETEAIASTAAELRNRIRDRPFDDGVAESITDAVSTLDDADGNGAPQYSVRSSATVEDLPTASFAGLYETFLGVSHDDVLDRVRDCMASLFTDRAVAYRARNDISNEDVEMAVVVQEMVDADAAGVLFTADPDTGNRTVAAIDATYGLGDPVVAGEVNADNARVDRETGDVLDYQVGEKAVELRLSDRGTERIETAPNRDRVLSDAQIGELVELGDRIEELFGEPQDIEWALVDDRFVVLQSRPITSLVAPPEPRTDDDRLRVYLSLGHTQAMTEPMPPLALDLWATVCTNLLNKYTGGSRAWVTRTEGRAYFDITPFLGFRAARDGIVETVGGLDETATEGTARLLHERRDEFGGRLSISGLVAAFRTAADVLPDVVRLIPGIIREGVVPFVRPGAGTDEYKEWFYTWGKAQEARILDEVDPERLVKNAFADFPVEPMFQMAPMSTRATVGPVTGRLLERIVPGADTALVDAAARGNEEAVGARMTLGLGDLADTAGTIPAVREAILDGRSLDEIRDVDGSEPFVEAFEAFLDDFGHRAVGEFDPSRPRWRDDPDAPLSIVRGNLREREEGAHRERLRKRKQEAAEAVDRMLADAGRGLLGPVRKPVATHLLRVYRNNIYLRDEPKHGVAHLFAAWHEALQQAGDHLVETGVLSDADDVWFLRHAELLRLLESPDGDVPDIDSRRRTHERYERTTVPPLITSEGEVPRVEGEEVAANVLVGAGVSMGVVEGRARVVNDLADGDLQAGDILVVPSTDPAWTPLFATAGGLVAEVGGRMTHGALVAREYGLPAVVSVTGATETIPDGQRIRVDGDRGTVEILEGEAG